MNTPRSHYLASMNLPLWQKKNTSALVYPPLFVLLSRLAVVFEPAVLPLMQAILKAVSLSEKQVYWHSLESPESLHLQAGLWLILEEKVAQQRLSTNSSLEELRLQTHVLGDASVIVSYAPGVLLSQPILKKNAYQDWLRIKQCYAQL
ncbi:MAG: DNA polymerase III subunit psi [Legionellaceae bacterium]|nr:DNA polymerase III subunit psi [Legionellaceae bacterium]